MSRIKEGIMSHKRRKNVLKDTKSFRWGRKSKYRYAKEALRHAFAYAYRDRKTKKRLFRQNWQRTISNALQNSNARYSIFANQLKKRNIALDRKILAQLAANYPDVFQKIADKVR